MSDSQMSAHDHGNCELCDQLERELAAKAEECEALRKDAERYRYLRSRNKDEVFDNDGVAAGVWIDCTSESGTLQLLTEEDADAAIDAAREGK